jgi:opacity protein-like surface antigen
MKKILLILLLVLLPGVLLAADNAPGTQGRPHWSLELKGGLFYPDIKSWKQYYGDDKIGQYGLAFSYKIFRMLELGIEGSYIKDDGQGFAPSHGTTAGSVSYELIPVNVFVLFRGIVNENQWVVPYVGGGYTYMFYREKIQFQNSVNGHTDGYHGRAGLQILLDGLDRGAANNLYRDAGVYHTYLFIEAHYSRAVVNTPTGSVNLGGTSYLGGLLFEF